MLTKIITVVPDDLFLAAETEINAIDFSTVRDARSNSAVFNTSTAVHLRVHKPPKDKPLPKTINEWSMITECVDHPANYNKYPAVVKLCWWVFNQVNGVEMGRIMIVNLAAGGHVDPHIDPLDYFEQHSRYHIPFKTNKNVVFNDGSGSADEHMPYKTLCRLNNRLVHALYNRSDQNRIHLLVDIKQPSGNEIF